MHAGRIDEYQVGYAVAVHIAGMDIVSRGRAEQSDRSAKPARTVVNENRIRRDIVNTARNPAKGQIIRPATAAKFSDRNRGGIADCQPIPRCKSITTIVPNPNPAVGANIGENDVVLRAAVETRDRDSLTVRVAECATKTETAVTIAEIDGVALDGCKYDVHVTVSVKIANGNVLGKRCSERPH